MSDELDYIKLISADDHEFLVHRSCAMVSGAIKSMLSGLEGSTYNIFNILFNINGVVILFFRQFPSPSRKSLFFFFLIVITSKFYFYSHVMFASENSIVTHFYSCFH